MSDGIEISVAETYRGQVDKPWVRKIARAVLKAEGVAQPYEVSLVFTDPETVQQLNRDYRGVNEPTDVLAFSMRPEEADFVLPPDNVLHLGEVVISYPRAAEQAREQGHSTGRELALLVIHGLLHLLGYDHEKTGRGKRLEPGRGNFWRTSLKGGCN